MSFEPRLKDEILADLASAVVSRSGLSDLSKGSAVLSVLGAFADELEGIEFRMKQIRDSFTLAGSVGTDLDERVSDLPSGAIVRLGPGNATGSVLKLTRSEPIAADLIVPAGTVYGRSQLPGLEYIQDVDVTIPAGSAVWPAAIGDPYVSVTASFAGTVGNCATGSIDTVKTGPKELITVEQISGVTSGVDRESDDSLKKRAIAFISGLARCNLKSLESLCRGFTSSGGIQVRNAGLFEDPERPGITYVTIDDGTGFDGFEKDGVPVYGKVPAATSAPVVLFHENPARAPISSGQLQIRKVGNLAFTPAPLNADGSPRWISVYERGILYPDATLLDPGDEWKIEGYKVFTGPIAELQDRIEGHPSQQTRETGYRASGTRVIVSPANITYIPEMEINIALIIGADYTQAVDELKIEIVEYFKTLGPGQTFHKSLLYQHILNVFDYFETLEITIPIPADWNVQYDHSLRIEKTNITVI